MLTLPGPRRSSRPPQEPRPRTADPPRTLLVVGAHGQAGTTTLATLLPAHDAGLARQFLQHSEPAPADSHGHHDDRDADCASARLILVTRSTAWAAPMATTAAQALTAAGHRIDTLAIISDGYPDSPEATARFTALAPLVANVVRIPHAPALRSDRDPRSVRLPRRYRHALSELRATALPGNFTGTRGEHDGDIEPGQM